MEPLIDGGTEVEYGVNIQPPFLAELDPELFRDLTRPLYTLLILDVKFLEFNDLGQVALHVDDFILFREELPDLLSKLFDDPQT